MLILQAVKYMLRPAIPVHKTGQLAFITDSSRTKGIAGTF